MPLKVSDGIGAWIKDFQKSDAPQFKGKSEKERRDQAIAAYLSAKRGDQKEDVRSADKRPEKYIGPDGKPKIRMVAVDKTVVKSEAKRVVHSDRPDSLKSLRVMHPKPASDKAPFDGPYRKAGEVKKDKYGNVIKNVPRHLARKAARKAAGMTDSVNKYSDATSVMYEEVDRVKFHMTRADDHERHAKNHGHYDDENNQYARMDHEDAADAHKAAADAYKKHGFTRQYKKTANNATSLTKNAKQSSALAGKRLAMSYGESVNEETNFQVNIEGLPMMFMSGMGQGEIMQKLRKIVKQPSMIQSVKRVTDADVKKTFRLKAQGRDEEEQVDEAKLDELSPATMNRYKKAAASDLHKSFNKGISIISKPKTKKDQAALDKRMDKRKAGLNRAARISGTHGQQDEK